MKSFTKLSLLMLAMLVSVSVLWAQNMTPEEIKFHQQLEVQKDAALGPVTYAPNGTRAQGDDCTDPYSYGNINDPSQSGSIVSLGEQWYSFTGPDDMTVTVSLCGSGYDTKLEVWYACSDGTYAFYNDDACGAQSEITGVPFVGGATHYVKVYGYSTASGSYTLSITGVLPPPAPDPITAFPFSEDFESGSFPSTMIPVPAAQSDLTLTSYAANSSSYGAMYEGGPSSWGTTPGDVNAAFAYVDHVAKMEMEIVPSGQPGMMLMEFDLTQRYSFNSSYEWFRVLVNGNPIADVDGNLYHQASSATGDPWSRVVYDLSAYQVLPNFYLTLENSAKYEFDYYNDGDLGCVDNFDLYYLTIGDIEGYVLNGDGLSIAGATVWMEGYPSTTSDATGYYFLSQVAGEQQDVNAYKDGYNVTVDNFYVTPGGTTNHDFVLTQPDLTINPIYFDETLNPNEYLTTYLGILNTGDGEGYWEAVINYPSSSAVAGSQNISNIEPKDFSNLDYSGTNVSTIPGGNGQAARAGFDCPDGSVFAYPPVSPDNGATSDLGAGYQCYQNFSGATGAFTTVTVWAIHTTAPSGPRELQVEVYGPGSTPGALESSTIAMADPVNTGIQAIGYDTYAYTISVPSSSLTDGWISVAATGGSPTFYWLNTYGSPSYPSLQGTTVLGYGLAMCLSSSGVTGWLSLGDYDGTVPGNGGSQNVAVNFDATGTEVGEVYTAEIVMTTLPDVGTFNIPVTMTIFGDPLAPVTDLTVELTNMVTGQVDLAWAFSGDVTFQYFKIKRDGITVGTTTDLFYTDFPPAFGTYCYTVTPVFDEGDGVPAGPECIDWLIPALCWSPATLYNEQWPDSQEEVLLTLENCGDGMLDFVFPDYVSGSRFACDMQVALLDTYGDGWNGGSMDVLVNGTVVLDDITFNSGGGPVFFSFPVEGGDDISTVMTVGTYSGEQYFEMYDGDGTLIYTSPTDYSLPTGTVFGTCPQPSYIVDVEPAIGQIPGGETLDIILTYDATGFPAGLWDEWLNIETNDPLMLEDSIFNQMLVYIPGQLFGTVTDCNSGQAMQSVTVTAYGDLGEEYTATTDGSGYYEMYVDEDTYDVEFSLLGFETKWVVDTFAATGLMTEVSTDMCETPYPVNWVYADPNEADTECEVTWTLPMGPYEIIYDDGEADDFVVWTMPGGAVGVHFTPAGYPATVTGGRINVGDGSFPAGANFLGTQMAVGVLDDDGANGLPGTLLDSVIVDVTNFEWVDFENVFSSTITDGDFYIVMWQLGWATNSAPCAVDTDLPTVYRSAVKMPGAGWGISPYQDFMIRAIVSGPNAGVVSNASGSMVRLPKVTEGPFLATSLPKGINGTVKDGEFKPIVEAGTSRDFTNYTIARVSDFDPDLGPTTGTLTPIANPTTEIYNDLAFGGQPAGFYAYAVKAIYESNESEWVYSNTVAHLLDAEVTIEVTLCDGNSPEGAEVTLVGTEYPYHVLFGVTDVDGIYVFDSVIFGMYDLFVEKVGYTLYEHYDLGIYGDMTYPIVLTEKAYAPRNLYVEPLTSHATWDEPLITALFIETFEDATFPPEGWQSTTLGVGWFRSDDAGTGDWAIPAGDGFYAVSNDDAAGSTNDGSEDYLITPELDLRESDDFELMFSHFYDAAYSQLAFVEYSYDGGATWEVLESMSPVGDWTDVSIDLAMLSGMDSNPVWIAFHADDNGGEDNWASGWAVDNVEIRNGPSPILGYYVYLNDVFVAQTDVDTREYTFVDLAYGETYEACVRALYACGLSEPICYTWNSTYLHPPRNLGDEYIYGTNEVPLMWNPPMTGTIPMAAAFEVVYVGPQLDVKGPNVEAAPEITIIEFENADNSRAMGDLQFTFPDADASGEAGCETDGEFIYTSLWNGSSYIKYDLDGNMIESFGVAGTSGVRDMAYDGEFFYGAAASTTVYVMDFETQTLVTTFTAPTACRAMAYNSDDETFYGCDWSTDIVKFDATGANLGSFPSGLTGVYGLAFDEWSGASGEQFLWAYDQGANNLIQYALPGGAQTGLTIDVVSITGADPGAGAGGAFTHPALFAADKVTIGGNSQNDLVWGIELADYSGGGPGGGEIPDGLVSFNLYQDGVNIANIPYEGQGVDEWVTYVVNPLDPATYLFDVSAVYDLTIFGFPGDFGESAWEGTDTVEVVWGFDLPFFEGWDQGSFAFQGWSFNDNSENWVINSQLGNPEPSAEFTWDPLLEDDYTSTLTSNPITADLLTEGDIFFDFEIMLEDRNSTGEEKLLVEVYDGASWNQVAEFSNDGSFDFTSSHINITNYAMSRVFKVRFNAVGQNSFDVVSWFVDNISIYRECQAPTDLTGEYAWSATEDYGAEVCWEAPFIPGPIEEWIHWDNGEGGVNGVGLTNGGTFSVAARWDAGQLSDYAGTSITKMQYVIGEGFTQVVLKIWTGANASTLIYENDVTATSVAGVWTEVDLDTPITLNVGEELWVGYTTDGPAGAFPAAGDSGPVIAGYGDMISTDGTSWDPLSSFGSQFDYNWNVQFFVTETSSSSVTPMIDNTVYDTPEGTFESVVLTSEPTVAPTSTERDITGFNVYRMVEGGSEYELYDVVDYVSGQASYCYFDAYPNVDPQMGYYYQVTANYASDTDACESAPAMAYELPMNDFVYVFVTGIDNPDAASLTNVYPNPAQDMVTVSSSVEMTHLTVTNYVGQVVYTSDHSATRVELNTSSYQAGVYIIKIDTDNGVVTKRLIISR